MTVRTGGARTGAATVLTHVNHRGPSRHRSGARPALARWRLETGLWPSRSHTRDGTCDMSSWSRVR